MKTMILVCAILFAGCAVAPQHPMVHVVGTTDDQQRFSGVWRGHVDTLNADVELQFEGEARTATFGTADILWVRVSGNNLAGAFAPQFDPRCSCDVYTTFDAILDGSVLRGTLRQRVRMEWQDAGTWIAERAQ